jgi:hypothetical protein
MKLKDRPRIARIKRIREERCSLFPIRFIRAIRGLKLFGAIRVPGLLHLFAEPPQGLDLGLSLLLFRVGAHLFDQLFHVARLFAHVSFSFD